MNSPRQRQPLLLFAVCFALFLAGIYLSFVFGEYQAGYSMSDERRQVAAYEQTIAERDAAIVELMRQQAILDTSREIDRETFAQVEADLRRLQARIQAQEEELVFYRGIVSPEDGVAGLRIQNLQIQPTDSEQHHVLRLVLVQAIVHSRRVAGTVRVKLTGNLHDEVTEIDLEQLLVDGGVDGLAYGFRYFQSFEQELVLPVGFEPDTVEVEIWPSQPRGGPTAQSFEWSLVNG